VGKAHGISKKEKPATKWLNNILLCSATFGADIVGFFHPWASPPAGGDSNYALSGLFVIETLISILNSHKISRSK
jgi:hypothetical protein